MTREIPLYTLDGVRDADVSTHEVTTADGLELSLTRFTRHSDGDVVLLVHGLTTSTDMFVMPEHRNLVSHLLDEGFDVWCLDTRMSNRFGYNLTPHQYTLDDLALFDFPPALELVRSQIGARSLHVIAHCLGSAAFTMSLFARAVSGITSVVANSVALTPRVPRWSRLKLAITPALLDVVGIPYLNPRWGEDPGITVGKVLARTVSLFHRECDERACHVLSLMWGTGWPALYHHRNLDDRTHRRVGDLFGPTSMQYYRHVRMMVRAGNSAIKYRPGEPRHAALPDDYFVHAREISTPILFTTGAENRVFADSNVECHRRLAEMGCAQHELKVFPGYGHQDVFMGKDSARDVFGHMVDFLRRHRAAPPTIMRESTQR
ncbi:MAG: alpha/beta fold hydrolase [Pseudonocardia sp.]